MAIYKYQSLSHLNMYAFAIRLPVTNNYSNNSVQLLYISPAL